MYGFYTPDLAMNEIKPGDTLIVMNKHYDPKKDMVYWEFVRAFDDII